MKTVVADASVAAKWYISENFTTGAEKLLDGSYEIHAPELINPGIRQHNLEESAARRNNR